MTWNTLTLADAYKPRPPIEYVVKPLFELPSLSIVYGAPGSLKSFVLQDMSICIAAGRDWLQPELTPSGNTSKAFKTQQTGVLWVDQDNGQRRTLERFEALAKGYGRLDENTPLYIVTMPNPWLTVTKASSMIVLRDAIKGYNAKLVVIDNLGTILGNADENSAEMITILSELRQLAENEGVAIIVIHHQRKSNGVKGRAGETLRGHSSIEAALDVALLVEREVGTTKVKVICTKARGVPIPIFGAKFIPIAKQNSEYELDLAYFEGFKIDDVSTPEGLRALIRQVLEDNSPGLNQKDLIAKVKDTSDTPVGINRIRNMAEQMVRDGEIDAVAGTKNSIYYTLQP